MLDSSDGFPVAAMCSGYAYRATAALTVSQSRSSALNALIE